MVLFVNNICVDEYPKSTYSFFRKHPVLVSEAKKWTNNRESKTIPECGTLYVGQREVAIVPGNDTRVQIIGSDDATTCHIMILRHKDSGGVALAHFDGGKSEEASLQVIIDSLLGNTNNRSLDVYAIGGFHHEKFAIVKGVSQSQVLSLKLLKVLMTLNCNFHIVQWCCCELNTIRSRNNSVKPLFHGLCWDRTELMSYPAKFMSHGPDATLRSAASLTTFSPVMTNIYDHINNSITIMPFKMESYRDWGYYINQPNEWILRYWSTSPSAEPPHFCDQMRKLFTLLATHPDPMGTLFDQQKPIVYVLDVSGNWKKK